MASIYNSMNRKDVSLVIYEKVVEGYQSVLGPDDFSTLISK